MGKHNDNTCITTEENFVGSVVLPELDYRKLMQAAPSSPLACSLSCARPPNRRSKCASSTTATTKRGASTSNTGSTPMWGRELLTSCCRVVSFNDTHPST